MIFAFINEFLFSKMCVSGTFLLQTRVTLIQTTSTRKESPDIDGVVVGKAWSVDSHAVPKTWLLCACPLLSAGSSCSSLSLPSWSEMWWPLQMSQLPPNPGLLGQEGCPSGSPTNGQRAPFFPEATVHSSHLTGQIGAWTQP